MAANGKKFTNIEEYIKTVPGEVQSSLEKNKADNKKSGS